MVEPFPLVNGRPPRVALLVYNHISTDNRVLKTAASLRAAGADVIIVGTARPGHPAGSGAIDGTAIFRVRDFDLASLLPWLAAPIRRRRNAAAARAAERAEATQAPTGPAVPDTAAPETAARATAAATPAPVTAPPLAVPGLLADPWLRLFQVVRMVWFHLGAVRRLRHWQPDIVHANDGNTLAPALLLRALGNGRIIYDAHELWTRRNVRAGRILAPLVESLTERLGVAASAGVITVSPSIVTWMRRRFRLRVRPTLVRNIPHRNGPVPARADGRLRELAELPPSTPVVAYCGGVTTGRGLEETVQALADLDGVHLVMLGYGDPAYLDSLRALATTAGVADRVHLVGPVPGPLVPQTLADADVSVVYVRPICLSYRYSLPNKLFESIHGGLPVVAADLPDTADIVGRYGIGEVFASGRPDQLARAIERVIAESDRYRAAARAAADDLDWSNEERELIALYARALRSPR